MRRALVTLAGVLVLALAGAVPRLCRNTLTVVVDGC